MFVGKCVECLKLCFSKLSVQLTVTLVDHLTLSLASMAHIPRAKGLGSRTCVTGSNAVSL